MPRSRLARLVLVVTATITTALMSSAPVMADASTWKVGYYTPSGRALSFANAKPGAGIASFDFTNQPDTALLVTTHGAYKGSTLGNLTGKTITATFDISGATGAFTYWGEGTASNPCGTPANTRLFFQTDNGGGFAYTHYWWSNPMARVLIDGDHGTLIATVEPLEWSDWDGKPGAIRLDGFADAASNVTTIGLSFGGGCFFENGVGTTDGSGTFTLTSFSVS
jgi:hypothetical protein